MMLLYSHHIGLEQNIRVKEMLKNLLDIKKLGKIKKNYQSKYHERHLQLRCRIEGYKMKKGKYW